jgi:hypothetical protein
VRAAAAATPPIVRIYYRLAVPRSHATDCHPVLVVSRFPSIQASDFLAEAQRALEVLAQRPGFRLGRVARAADDPNAWVMVTEWENIGAWRRALSAYEVKLESTPLLAQAADEPSAYEVLVAVDTGSTGSTGGTVITGSDRTD